MSKFNKMLHSVDRLEGLAEIDKTIGYLSEIKEVLREAIDQYSDSEKLNSHKDVWYQNARESYERKFAEINRALTTLEAKRIQLLPQEDTSGACLPS